MACYRATGAVLYPFHGWSEPTLPLPAKCDYCGRDGGVNFVCDGCGAPRQARVESARVDRGYVTAPFDDLVKMGVKTRNEVRLDQYTGAEVNGEANQDTARKVRA